MTYLDDNTDVFTNHNVYILGAGFSKGAGMPVIKDFLNEMRTSVNWLKQDERREYDATRKVLLFRKKAASAALRVDLDVENIEDLFSLAAASGEETPAQNISSAIAATIEYCRSHRKAPLISVSAENDYPVPAYWKKPLQEAAKTFYDVSIYDLYAGLLSGGLCEPQEYMKNTVISFNYDTVLEDALSRIGVPIDYGISPDLVTFHDSWKSGQVIGNKPLKLLKIHGSVNWFQDEPELQNLIIYRAYNDGYASGSVFLIPPTWRKDFSGPLGDVWSQAVQALREATRIVFLGFSFPDTDVHIKYLMAAGLQENISLRNIFCINKDPRVKKSFLRTIKRDLERQGIASFSSRYISNLIQLFPQQYKYYSEDFSRALHHKLHVTPFSLPDEAGNAQPTL